MFNVVNKKSTTEEKHCQCKKNVTLHGLTLLATILGANNCTYVGPVICKLICDYRKDYEDLPE